MHAWEEGAGDAELVEAEEAMGEDDGRCGGRVGGAEGCVGVGYEGPEGGETGIRSRMGRKTGGEGSLGTMVGGRRSLNEG